MKHSVNYITALVLKCFSGNYTPKIESYFSIAIDCHLLQQILFSRHYFTHRTTYIEWTPTNQRLTNGMSSCRPYWKLWACITYGRYVNSMQNASYSWAHSWRPYSAASLGHRATGFIHDLLFHSVTLSWHLANQSFSYPNNDERWARKRQVSILILKSLV